MAMGRGTSDKVWMTPAFLPAAKEKTVLAIIAQVSQLHITRQSRQGAATTHAKHISSWDG